MECAACEFQQRMTVGNLRRSSGVRTDVPQISELREALDAANAQGDLREALDAAHGHDVAGRCVDELVTALEHAADTEPGLDSRSRLHEAAKTLGTLWREVATDIIAKIITSRMGM
jgi:hypothetical protein